MPGLVHAQGAAEPDASVRLCVRSHVPGTSRNRAQAEEAGVRKAKPHIKTPSTGKGPQTRCIAFGNPIRRWAVFSKGSAREPPPENAASEREGVAAIRWQRPTERRPPPTSRKPNRRCHPDKSQPNPPPDADHTPNIREERFLLLGMGQSGRTVTKALRETRS